MEEEIVQLRLRWGNLHPPRSGNYVAAIGALNTLDVVAIESTPHREFDRIARKRSALRRLKLPVAAATPRASIGIAWRPELMACPASSRGDVICRKQCVNQNLTLAFLKAKTFGIAKYLFAVVGVSRGSIHPRHIDAV